jgi:hypothetical protein
VMFEYSTDNGTNWTTIVASIANTSPYPWTVPNAITPTATALVRVSDTRDASVNAVSNAFKIIGQYGPITAPATSDSWLVGTQQNIVWTTSAGTIPNVMLEYSTDNGTNWTTIIATTPNTSPYSWTVPNAITPTATAQVRVSDTRDASVNMVSNTFKIIGGFALMSPVGNESWVVGSSHNILWSTAAGTISNVMLEYSTDNGTNWTTIVDSVANSGTYPWTIPDTMTSQALVRLSQANDPTVNKVSPVNFRIIGQLNLTAPVGNEQWVIGTQHNITWAVTAGTFANVKIDYSTNAGGSWSSVTASAPNNARLPGRFPTLIPIRPR